MRSGSTLWTDCVCASVGDSGSSSAVAGSRSFYVQASRVRPDSRFQKEKKAVQVFMLEGSSRRGPVALGLRRAQADPGVLVIIDFTASWCGPCRFIAPVFAEYAKKFPGATFLKVDVDELKEVAEKYSVQAMPTFLLIKDGETVDTVVGARKEELQSNIAKHVAA